MLHASQCSSVIVLAAVAADSGSSTSGTVITINVSIVDTMSQLVSSSRTPLLVAPAVVAAAAAEASKF
jgi:hypothetical protein